MGANHFRIAKGLTLAGQATAPGSIVNGDVYYDTVGNKFNFRENGSWVTIPSAFTSPLTTKGDLFTYTTTNARLPVGVNGQYLSADSTEATGLKWVTPSAGGGGGSSLVWVESGTVPYSDIVNNDQVYLYDNSTSQNLYATVRVPNSYSAGSPVNIRILAYSPDSSGNFLIRAQSTLVRPGTDAITSTTNQRTTTNSAISLSGGTVNIPQTIVLDIASTSGQINGVSLAAGHLIKVRLYRDTDTAASDVSFIAYSGEVTFS